MQWGLLAGIGKGLSQGADIVSRGLAEDRSAKREDARYQSQIAREDARAAAESDRWERTFKMQREQNELANARGEKQMKLSEQQAANAQANADRQFNFAEQQAAIQADERERNSISKTFEVLDNQFNQKMKMLQARGQKDELTGQMKYDQATIEQMNQLGKEYEVATQRALQMLGDSGRLNGTPYEAAYRMSFGSDNNLAGDVAKEIGGNMGGAAGAATGSANARPQISLDGENSGSPNGSGQKPLIQPGFLGGVQLGMGGFYNNQMAADRSSMSPAERATTTVGQGVGLIGGLLKDVGELGVEGVDWITRKPTR